MATIASLAPLATSTSNPAPFSVAERSRRTPAESSTTRTRGFSSTRRGCCLANAPRKLGSSTTRTWPPPRRAAPVMCPAPSRIGPRFLTATRRRSTISLTVTATIPDRVLTIRSSDSFEGSGAPTASESETHGMAALLNRTARPLVVVLNSAFARDMDASTAASGRPQNWSPRATTTTF